MLIRNKEAATTRGFHETANTRDAAPSNIIDVALTKSLLPLSEIQPPSIAINPPRVWTPSVIPSEEGVSAKSFDNGDKTGPMDVATHA